MVNVLLSVIFHAALQPQNGKAGQCGGIEFRKDSDILLIRIQALCLIPDIRGDGGQNHVVIVPAQRFLIAGVVQVVHSPLILCGKGRGIPERLLPAVVPVHLGLKILRFQLENILHKSKDIHVIVIKGIAVHAAVIYNIPNGNLAQRLLVQ